MKIDIESCGADDVDAVVQFLDAHWKRGHVLVRSRRLLDWQYQNADGTYSFLVARRGGDIVGLLGYIATRRYDPSLAAANVIWLTTWKVRADANVAGLGLALLQHLDAAEPHVGIGAIGLNPATRPMYAALGYRVGELRHYSAPASAIPADTAVTSVDLVDAADFDRLQIAAPDIAPLKTPRYFQTRYAVHPFYRYRVVALRRGGACLGVLAVRVAEHGGCRALRIVDFAGAADALAGAGRVIQTLIRDHEAAYADVYNAGIDESVFACAGFHRIDPDGDEIVPDHFEPFEARNIRLWFAFKGQASIALFKGDADQDRPSRLGSDER